MMDYVARPGDLLGERYELVEPLGTGASGQVFRARDRLLGNAAVAVKILFSSLLTNEAAIARFRNEAGVTREIAHPGLVQIYDFGCTGENVYFLVMELVEGCSLRKLLEDNPSGVGIERAIELTKQLADAMAAAHRFGVVHRDLKPENVLIDKSGRARIADFGVALAQDANALTVSGELVGTVDYMSPEQLSGRRVDARADVFALGLISIELLTGQLPWSAEQSREAFNRFSRRRLVVSEVSPELPLPLVNVLDRALEVDLKRRWPDAGALSAALNEVSGARVGALRRYLNAHVRIAKLRRRARRCALVVGIVAAISIGLIVADRERLVRVAGLLLFERFTGISALPVSDYLGLHAEYSQKSMLRCMRESNTVCVRAIMLAGMSLDFFGEDGSAFIHLATLRNPTFAARSLLNHGVKLDVVDSKGRTPMMLLYRVDRPATVEVIAAYLKKQPDLLRRDYLGRSVLWYAAAVAQADVWEQMVREIRSRYGAQVLKSEVNQRNIDGLPLVHLLVGSATRAPLGYLDSALAAIKDEVDVNAVAPDGMTAIMRVKDIPLRNTQSITQSLLRVGADPNPPKGAVVKPRSGGEWEAELRKLNTTEIATLLGE